MIIRRDGSGFLDDYDIAALLATPPDTSNLDDESFDTHHHDLAANSRTRDADVMDESSVFEFNNPEFSGGNANSSAPTSVEVTSPATSPKTPEAKKDPYWEEMEDHDTTSDEESDDKPDSKS